MRTHQAALAALQQTLAKLEAAHSKRVAAERQLRSRHAAAVRAVAALGLQCGAAERARAAVRACVRMCVRE